MLSDEKYNQNNKEIYASIHVMEKSRRTNIFITGISKIGDLKAMYTNADQFLNKKRISTRVYSRKRTKYNYDY